MQDIADKAAIVRVGDGRGFIIAGERNPVVITAAHCLPKLPPAHGFSYVEERTYPKILGPINGGLGIWAECLFADPVADIAILGEPDDQILFDECEAYEAMMEGLGLMIGEARNGPGFVLSLENEWLPVELRAFKSRISFSPDVTSGGMSGSPIIQAGRAVGVVALGGGEPKERSSQGRSSDGNPLLVANLPGWMLRSK